MDYLCMPCGYFWQPTSENSFKANFRECPKGEVRRILIPRTPVNKGKKKAEAVMSPGPHNSGSRTLCRAYFALCATTSPSVIWGGFGNTEARPCSPMYSPALQVDSSAPDWCSKTLIETITPSPASTKE